MSITLKSRSHALIKLSAEVGGWEYLICNYSWPRLAEERAYVTRIEKSRFKTNHVHCATVRKSPGRSRFERWSWFDVEWKPDSGPALLFALTVRLGGPRFTVIHYSTILSYTWIMEKYRWVGWAMQKYQMCHRSRTFCPKRYGWSAYYSPISHKRCQDRKPSSLGPKVLWTSWLFPTTTCDENQYFGAILS
jgi:hypothetical protein